MCMCVNTRETNIFSRLPTLIKMSFLSLPRTIYGENAKNSNSNYSSLSNRRAHEDHKKSASTLSLQAPSRRRILNRNGSIATNHFRGVHKHLIEKHAETVCHSMTVSNLANRKGLLAFIFKVRLPLTKLQISLASVYCATLFVLY